MVIDSHFRAPKAIEDDIKLRKFLDGASDEGVIYVSFGSVIKASLMGEDKRKALLNVFGKLKQKVLWKWETEHMDDKPPNVMLHKWLPQQDVLGHPNVKLFISHGGQSSFQETVCHQKPAVSSKFNNKYLYNLKLQETRKLQKYNVLFFIISYLFL